MAVKNEYNFSGALGKKNKPTSTVIDLTRESCDFAYVLSETGPKAPVEDKHLCDLQVYGKPYEIYNRGWVLGSTVTSR